MINNMKELIEALKIISNSLPKYIEGGYTECLPYLEEDSCMIASLTVQIDIWGNKYLLTPIYTTVCKDFFDDEDDEEYINSDCNKTLNSYYLEDINTETLKNDFSDRIGKIDEFLYPDCFETINLDLKTIKKINEIYESLPNRFDRKEDGEFEIKANYGEQAYIDNVELGLHVSVDNENIYVCYYSEDDLYYYVDILEHKKYNKNKLIDKFSKKFGWIEKFE